ncbi:MAG: hypothetical protein PUB20_01140 [Clostridia bacterium]|nr:hypothetical protein [Clostridia bacterium]
MSKSEKNLAKKEKKAAKQARKAERKAAVTPEERLSAKLTWIKSVTVFVCVVAICISSVSSIGKYTDALIEAADGKGDVSASTEGTDADIADMPNEDGSVAGAQNDVADSQPSGEEESAEPTAGGSGEQQVQQTAPQAGSSTAVTKAPSKATATGSTTTTKAAAKNVTVYKSEGTRKIWAGVVGEIYVLFRNIETPTSNGMKGQVYELYVDAGDGYTVWSDGYWELNSSKTELKLTPKHQNENGNIGVDVGSTKTYTADKGVFKVEFTFEQGGKSAIKLNPAKDIAK